MNKILLFTFVFVSVIIGQELPQIKNVVVILADDHAQRITGIYGNKIIRTPNIDRLADQGIRFNNSFCNSPICSASRQSLLTGKYPHSTGVNLLFTPFPDQGNITIAEYLKKYEYKTALIGKSHFNNWTMWDLYKEGLPDHGFDTIIQKEHYRKYLSGIEPKKIPDSIQYYGSFDTKISTAERFNHRVLPHPVFDEQSSGTFFANEALQFMQNSKDEPFFLWLAFYEPHSPFYFPIEYKGKYRPEDMPLPEGSHEDDRWIPEIFRNLSDDEKRGIVASYYTSTEYMDKNIGLVLNAIEEMDLAESTLIIYISDNGYLLNHHKRFEKHTMWEEAVKQPMIFKFGNDFRKGEVSNAIVEYIDIVPTIIDLLELPEIDECQGKSFRTALSGVPEFRKFAFSEYLEDNLAMIRSNKWKYVFTSGRRDLGIGYRTGYGASGIVHRLYNLADDPKESISLADDPKYTDTLDLMKNEMLRVFMETHPDAKKCPKHLTLDGKLAWFCEPRDIGSDQSFEDTPYKYFYKN